MDADGCASGFRCVQCGFPVDTLYIQYSPGNIRLMKCEYCKAVVDEYIECEVMILILDLILHKPKAYRHLFYNRFSKETVNFEGLLWKSILAFFILDIYRMWVLRMSENEWTLPVTVVSFLLEFGKMFTGVVLENLIFLAVMIHGTGKLMSASARVFGWKEVLLIVIISSYFKIFLVAMMVWKFPSSVIFIIDMFVVSSNYVALKGAKNGFVLQYHCKKHQMNKGWWDCDHRHNDGEMLDSLPRGSWLKVFILSRTYHPMLNLTNTMMLMRAMETRCCS